MAIDPPIKKKKKGVKSPVKKGKEKSPMKNKGKGVKSLLAKKGKGKSPLKKGENFFAAIKKNLKKQACTASSRERKMTALVHDDVLSYDKEIA